MSSKARYVFDTNVIVSSLLFKNSNPSKAFRYALQHGEVLLSLELLEELSDVLGREKFDRFITSEERDEFLETFVERATLIEVIERVQECRDPKDDKILELALNGQAEYIVSGDKDLLVLNPFREVNIVTVEEFVRIFQID
ncbi:MULTISPECIES: putative toxin-antitoxin system toxin component, PIN family [Leptolyngbya]|uniref:putative toxin-antitoxin system toxin component, PIN family n=1 Tax=Leptolyngbya TaxID=47251 RepID=UPI0016881C1B|nr:MULTISPECIES: putative toxin-antitoxin system toxin component, PIN family [unclassified Leptolyngbya]MBD1855058.1 putative toxin-antitoxin system toxin component, PIN family [Leptolyngbya sp. FACHB-1624]MBN8564626.1 putative toxin-antitoxin system toxin component, PIN family [Leptolyngbya sp. UWPOB_LEPTO1]